MNGVTQREWSFLLLLWGLSDPRIAELREMPQSFIIKLYSETQVSGRLGMSGGISPRHAQNPLSGERRKTLSITHHALSPPPSHHHLYIIHLINWLQRFYRIIMSLKRPFVPKSDVKQLFTTLPLSCLLFFCVLMSLLYMLFFLLCFHLRKVMLSIFLLFWVLGLLYLFWFWHNINYVYLCCISTLVLSQVFNRTWNTVHSSVRIPLASNWNRWPVSYSRCQYTLLLALGWRIDVLWHVFLEKLIHPQGHALHLLLYRIILVPRLHQFFRKIGKIFGSWLPSLIFFRQIRTLWPWYLQNRFFDSLCVQDTGCK